MYEITLHDERIQQLAYTLRLRCKGKDIWVTEVWRSQQEHGASLTVEGVQEAISHILPLLAGSPEKIDLLPVGGKGFTSA